MDEYWIVGARIVDGTGAEPRDGAAVHVVHGRIAGLGPAPTGAETVDATGLTLTPGLIDAHIHFGLSSEIAPSMRRDLSAAELAADMFNNCSQTLDAGFTTVRDTGGIDAGLARVVAEGKVRGPRILQCGPMHCQTGGNGYIAAAWEPTEDFCHHAIPGLRALALMSDGPDEMRKNVRETFRRGADFLKLSVTGGVVSWHDKLSDTQFAVEEIAVAVEEASARGTYVTVHAHNNVGIRNAVRAGVKCVEHGSSIDEATAALMAEHGVALVPTLAVVDALIRDSPVTGLPEPMLERLGHARHGQEQAVLVARAAGVKVGSGSDLIGLKQSHRGKELTLRAAVENPMLALQSATQINAEIIGLGDEVGTVEVGKVADLTAWAADPMECPEIFGDPSCAVLVVQGGRIVKQGR